MIRHGRPRCRRRRLRAGVAAVAGALLLPASGAAQQDSVVVAAGPRYEAGAAWRALFGAGYRDLWTAPVSVPVLDLDTFAGGLTPVRTGGNVQTVALRFRGADGREYNFRSVDKELTPALPPYARETLVDRVRQDQTSAQHPVAPVVSTVLLDAAGILNPGPRLVVLPHDPALGEFRDRYAGMLGTIEVHADENRDDPSLGFAGAVRVAGTDRLLEHLAEDGVANRVDSRAYLAARLMDVLLGDWDRHEGQWRWAREDRGDLHWWTPVPEDRDYAFVDHDGVLSAVLRAAALPRLVRFRETYPDLLAMMSNSLELNRRLLAELPRAAWDSAAVRLQSRLTDRVIARAVGSMPPAYREARGGELARILRARRDGLPAMAERYYRLMAEAPEVHGSALDERVEVRRDPDGTVRVRLFARDGGDAVGAPHFDRTFHPEETGEVRVVLKAGDDLAEVHGAGGPVRVRIVGGPGDDRLVDRSRGPTVFHDADGENEFERGAQTRVDRRPATPPAEGGLLPVQRRDWGNTFRLFAPGAAWDPHAGPVIGGGPVWTRYGFRHHPFRSRHSVRILYAPAEGDRAAVEYEATHRRTSSPIRIDVLARASSIAATRFHGFGNTTPDLPAERAVAWGRELDLHLAWVFPFAREVTFRAGPLVRYADREPPRGSPAAEVAETGSWRAGAAASIEVDTRDDAVFPRRGFRVTAASEGALALDGGDAVGRVAGRGSLFLSLGSPVLVLRAGGERALGDFPFHQAAYVGGSRTVRGYEHQRFAGDAALHGTAEARIPVLPANVILRGRLGVSAFADAGRVYHRGESAGSWHVGTGAGIWFATPLAAVSLHYVRGDGRSVYLQVGMPHQAPVARE